MSSVHARRGCVAGLVFLAALAGAGCGGSSHPRIPGAPSGLVAVAGNGQVTLSWTASEQGSSARFRIYYGTGAGVTPETGTRIDDVATTSTPVTGLTNDTTYYFVVTAFNSSGESAASNEAPAMPVPPGDFAQADLAGTWRFQAVAAGTSPGWMRGTVTVAADGTTTIDPYLDSAGNTTAPSGLFAKLLVDPAGQVRDADNIGDAAFTGALGATHRNKIVGTSSSAGTQHLAVFLKHDPAVTFTQAGDVNGFGSTSGGARRFAYGQLATASSPREWEYAEGQLGANSPPGGVQYRYSTTPYPFLSASGTVTVPSDKATVLSITADGVVSEAVNGTPTTAPRLVMGTDAGFMSDDKATIVATATDPTGGGSGASDRYVLRIYQLINIEPVDGSGNDQAGGQPLTFAPSDLGGAAFRFRDLAVSDAGAQVASGTLAVDGTTGALTFGDYADGASGTAPDGFTVAIDSPAVPAGKVGGLLTCGDDASIHGKLGDFKDLLVLTRTVGGTSRLTVAVR